MKNTNDMVPVGALMLTGPGYDLTTIPDVMKARDEMIDAARAIKGIATAADDEFARVEIRRMADMRIMVEKGRVLVKKPVLDLGNKIDAAAKDFLGVLADEERRLEGERKKYAMRIEAERQEAARQKQAADRERIRLEIEAEKAREEEAYQLRRAEAETLEAQRLADAAMWEDDAASTAEAFRESERLAAIADAKRQAIEQAESERMAKSEAIMQQMMVAPAPAAPKGTKMKWGYKIVNLRALLQFSTEEGLDLVSLSERRGDISALLKQFDLSGQPPIIPGLIVTKEVEVSTR